MIEIVDHRPRWSAEFQSVGRHLRQVLGDQALRIDHIGSTSVPGLAAKDVIDVQLTVARLDHSGIDRISVCGFVHQPDIRTDHVPAGYRGPVSDWAKLFFTQAPGQRRVHLHVRAQGHPNQRYALLFRDYLTAHPAQAAAYAELKRRLAHSLHDEGDYADVKDPAVDLIYFAAEQWAAWTSWQPTTSGA